MRYEIRELRLGEILDQAVNLTKNHFGLFFSILAVLQLPFSLLLSFAMLSLMPAQLEQGATPDEAIEFLLDMGKAFLYLSPGLLLFFVVVTPIVNAAMIHAIAAQYLRKPVTLGSAIGRAFAVFPAVIGTSILVFLTELAGLLMLIVPFFFFIFFFALTTHVVVIEGTSGIQAMKRSKALMKDNYGNLFALGLLLWLIMAAINSFSSLIPQLHVQVVVSSVLQAIGSIFVYAVMVVFYFSCRCHNENFDLTLLAQAVGEESPPPESSGAVPG